MKKLKQVMDEYCLFVLKENLGNRTRSSKALGITRKTLIKYIAVIKSNPEYREAIREIDDPKNQIR
jgi:DNA-binding NtrC family response regulator